MVVSFLALLSLAVFTCPPIQAQTGVTVPAQRPSHLGQILGPSNITGVSPCVGNVNTAAPSPTTPNTHDITTTITGAQTIAPGLEVSPLRCEGVRPIQGHIARMTFNGCLQFRALQNTSATDASLANKECGATNYGPMMPELVNNAQNFEVLAATNGNFFWRRHGRYEPRGLLWTASSDTAGDFIGSLNAGANGSSLSSDLLVTDNTGPHFLSIRTQACPSTTNLDPRSTHDDNCVTVINPPTNSPYHPLMTQIEFIEALKTQHPRLTLALQLDMPLTQRRQNRTVPIDSYRCPASLACQRNPRHACTTNDVLNENCTRLPRTLLCVGNAGTLSTIVTNRVNFHDMAVGLAPGGTCNTNCRFVYNIDGGTSTQMGYRRPENRNAFEMNHGRVYDPNHPTPYQLAHCQPYRAVQHILAIGRDSRNPTCAGSR